MSKKILGLLVSLFLFSNILFAVPFTTSGFMKVPDAYILPGNILKISYSSYLYNPHWERCAAEDKWNLHSAYNFTYGVLDWGEIGFVYNMLPKLGRIYKDIYSISAKVSVVKATEKFPAISIGVENILSESNIDSSYIHMFENKDDPSRIDTNFDIEDYQKNSAFVTLSKPLKFGNINFDILAGLGIGHFKALKEDKQMFKGVFFALKTSYKNFSLVLEEDGSAFNAGLQYDLGNISIKTGIYRLDEMIMANPHPRISFSLQYEFNLLSTLKGMEKTSIFSAKFKKPEEKKEEKGFVQEEAKEDFGAGMSSLEEELKKIREKRQKAEKDLEELRKLLEE